MKSWGRHRGFLKPAIWSFPTNLSTNLFSDLSIYYTAESFRDWIDTFPHASIVNQYFQNQQIVESVANKFFDALKKSPVSRLAIASTKTKSLGYKECGTLVWICNFDDFKWDLLNQISIADESFQNETQATSKHSVECPLV